MYPAQLFEPNSVEWNASERSLDERLKHGGGHTGCEVLDNDRVSGEAGDIQNLVDAGGKSAGIEGDGSGVAESSGDDAGTLVDGDITGVGDRLGLGTAGVLSNEKFRKQNSKLGCATRK